MNPSVPLLMRDVSVGYKQSLAKQINLEIRSREFVTLMGENGTGKTTLIDCMMGSLQPQNGEVLFWGQTNSGRARATINQKVGWVISQRENYPLVLTVDGFFKKIAVNYPTWNWGLYEQLREKFALDTTKRLFHLSSGEHSKVRLIKALSFEPALVVLDELTANLSQTSKESLLASLLDLFARNEMSILYICHSNEEAIKLSDRIYQFTSNGLRLLGGQNA